MTPQEYRKQLETLKEQEIQLAQRFIEENPFKELEGKLVTLTIGCAQHKVLFVGAGFKRNTFELGLFFHHLRKDGSPRKNSDFISVRFYDGRTYKIEKICRR